MQGREQRLDALAIAPAADVAQMPDLVTRADGHVPAFDHGAVHLVGRSERTPVDAEPPGIAEMVVAGEEDRHGGGRDQLRSSGTTGSGWISTPSSRRALVSTAFASP